MTWVQMPDLPLVAAQKGIWIADKILADPDAYAIAHYLDLQGSLNVELLQECILHAMGEADTLNMSYDTESMSQRPYEPLHISPEVLHLSTTEALQFMETDIKSDIRLESNRPLVKHAIISVGPRRWFWYQRYHHIQLDAFSFTALTRRIADYYQAGIHNIAPEPCPFTPMKSVISEYEAYENSPKWVKDASFWSSLVQSLPEAVSLSPKDLIGEQPSSNILRESLTFDKNLMSLLSEGSNPVDVAIAVVAIWYMRLTDSQCMSTGFIFMRRLGSAALKAMGPVINVLPMPIHMQSTLHNTATAISKTIGSMRKHQKYDAEQIVRDTGRSWDSAPLYAPVINVKAFDLDLDFPGLRAETHHIASGPVRDLEIAIFLQSDGSVKLQILANGNRFSVNDLKRHVKRLEVIASELVHGTPPQETKTLLLDERQAISESNDTYHTVNPNETLVSLVENQVALTPHKTAIQDESQSLTYIDMSLQAKALVHRLYELGVRSGDIVAVALTRSVFLSLALQGVIAAGAAWLSLDTDLPPERLKMMLQDAKPRLIVTNKGTAECLKFSDVPHFVYDDLLPVVPNAPLPQVTSQQAAYVLYTSGSTGRPKGTIVSHKAIVNRILWMQARYSLTPADVVAQKTPYSFDVSIWEFFWPIVSGASLALLPPLTHRDPEELQKYFLLFNITITHFVPSMLSAFLPIIHERPVSSLRMVFASGEALPSELARDWERHTGVPLYNLYGPTEAAVDVSYFDAFGPSLASVSTSIVPIGYPVWNTKLHVLNKSLQLLPPGFPGQLFIEGPQLADGYLNRPDLTAERFLDVNGRRMYATGDIVQWSKGIPGALEYLHRSDSQVKLRGQRIELGEIEATMLQVPGVLQAVVAPQILTENVPSYGDERQLIGYIVFHDEQHNLDLIRYELETRLPRYMVPTIIVPLAAFPLTPSGKLDRKALPIPRRRSHARELPSTHLEKVVAAAFMRLLNVSDISLTDNFFTLGGHSILAVRLVADLRKTLELPVALGQIMQHPTVGELASQLEDEGNKDSWHSIGFDHILKLRDKGTHRLFCIHPASGFAWQFSVLQKYLDPCWSLVGIQSASKTGPLAKASDLSDVVENHYHSIRSVQPNGPYFITGYSLGGTLAHALAARLVDDGEHVAFLGLLDTWPPETQNWSEKQGKNIVDQAVLDEMDRERAQFLAAQGTLDEASSKLFDIIHVNYASAVRLLTSAKSSVFHGMATLFVAEKTFPAGTNLNEVWENWTDAQKIIPVDCSHVDIISAPTFEILGPQINRELRSFHFIG